MERFVEVCRKRGVKINAGKSKVMVLVMVFKYLGCVFDESGTDAAECSKKVVSGRRVAGVLRSLILGVCSLSGLGSCMSYCWCLFLCMVVRQ